VLCDASLDIRSLADVGLALGVEHDVDVVGHLRTGE
jgi:hypothetical protein